MSLTSSHFPEKQASTMSINTFFNYWLHKLQTEVNQDRNHTSKLDTEYQYLRVNTTS